CSRVRARDRGNPRGRVSEGDRVRQRIFQTDHVVRGIVSVGPQRAVRILDGCELRAAVSQGGGATGRVGNAGDVAAAIGQRYALTVPIDDRGQLTGAVVVVVGRVVVAVRDRGLVARGIEVDRRAVGHRARVDKGGGVLGQGREVAGRGHESP